MSGAIPQAELNPERLLPEGLRIYAIGDLHGRFDLLQAMTDLIRRDLSTSRPPRTIEIFIGDYIDRRPQSRDVLDWLISSPPIADERICLLGNHEAMLLAALAEPADPEAMLHWLHNGGEATCNSYLAGAAPTGSSLSLGELRALFVAAFPAGHRAFVAALPRLVEFGSYFFVHAGIRPLVPLAKQSPEDLVWIREPFLSSTAAHDRIVVHGHTPCEQPEVRPNRINIDTGAYFTNRLTALVIEGGTRRFLQTGTD